MHHSLTRPLLSRVFVALLCVASAPLIAEAQLPQARLYSIFPPGAAPGSTTEVKLSSGADLDEVDRLYFNHPGITADHAGAGFNVTVAPDVPPGQYEVRASGLFGVSNPRIFVVDPFTTGAETEPNNTPEQAAEIKLNQTLNATINGGADVDVFKFNGHKGQRVIATCEAARIDSRLTAVISVFHGLRRLALARNNLDGDPLLDITLPADGEYLFRIHDEIYRGGAEYGYRFTVHDRPHIDYIMPPAGVPGTTGRFTLFGRNLPGGTPADTEIDGQPLQKLEVSVAVPNQPDELEAAQPILSWEANADGFAFRHGESNAVVIQYSDAVPTIEQEPNDTPQQSQVVTLPVELGGRFQNRGDVDFFAFEAKAGQVWFVDVVGQRLGSTADPYLTLDQVKLDNKGNETVKRITAQDDNTTNAGGLEFLTISNDPTFRFQVPEDGRYRLAIRDRYFESRGDPRLVYRLSIREELPDFRLIVLPHTPSPGANQPGGTGSFAIRKGENFMAKLVAIRRDGFDGRIDVAIDGLPDHVTFKGAGIGPGDTSAPLILSVSEAAAETFSQITVKGVATIDNPATARTLETARKTIQPAQDELAKLEKAAADAASALAKVTEQLAADEKAAADKPDDKALQQKLESARKTAEQAQTASTAASKSRDEAGTRLDTAKAEVAKAETAHAAARREVTHTARPGTIVWTGNQNVPSSARLAQSIGLSVMKDVAQFQTTTDANVIDVNQGSQILVPVKLAKRDGFDADVNLTFQGVPKNVDVENKKIAKGQTEEVLRLFVKTNAPEGTSTVYVQSQAQVPYRKNPWLVDREKAKQTEAAKAVEAADAAAKKAVADRDNLTTQIAEFDKALKDTTTTRDELTKQVATADVAIKTATETKVVADKAAIDTAANVKQAAEQETAARTATDAAPDNKELADALAAAQQTTTDATAAADAATTAATTADQTLKAAAAAAEKLKADHAKAEQTRAEHETALKAANESKPKIEEMVKQAEAAKKSAEEAKKAADKRVQDAENAAKPANKNVVAPSTALIITVRKAPAELKAAVPNGGSIKRGEKLEVKVTAKRVNGFAGPITLSLPLPSAVTGLSAEATTIPADQTEATLTIQAAADATEGKLANMVIHASMDFDGPAAVDAPVAITVGK